MKNWLQRLLRLLVPGAHAGATPTILQLEAVECGAASLAMILAYHDLWVPLEELRLACGVSRDGTKATNILRAARTYGLNARGFKKEPDQLTDLPQPSMVFWNFNHFVVLEQFAGKDVYLNDPALGKRKIPVEEFDQSFTGVVLTFERTPEFKPGGQKPSIVDAVMRRARGTQAALTFLLIAGLTAILPGLIMPTLSGQFVDRVLVGHATTWLEPLLIGMGVTAAFRLALSLLQNSVLLQMQSRMALVSAGQFFWHLLRLPVVFYTQRSAGEIGSRLQLNETIAQELVGDLTQTFLSLLTAMFYGLMMLAYDARLALIVMGAAFTSSSTLWFLRRKSKDLSMRVAVDAGKLQGASLAGLSAIETLKSTGGEAGFFARWAGYESRFLNAMQNVQRLQLPVSLIPGAINTLTTGAILGFGGLRVMDGAMSVGELVAFQSLSASFLGPVNACVGLVSKFQDLQGNIARLDDVLRYPARPVEEPAEAGPRAPAAPAVHTAHRLDGFLELKNVTFGYNKAALPLVEELSFVAQPGERIALVGPSGCGKSTVSKLIMGLYEPWSGEILFDGKPRSAWSREQLAASLAMVDQDLVLFGGTFRENLTLWDTTVRDQDILRAVQDACIQEMILAKPGGLDSMVDEGGRNMSGGQRQRIEIARALAGNPRMLVLDEATSALDVATERQVDGNLRRRGVTCVIIAHRLSTIRDADEILVMNQGRLVERGTHETLMAIPLNKENPSWGGYYHRLVAEGTPG
jgi:NHLM bacteriocin system ABC transporter peptidase/ATP-binding protein